MLTQQELDQIRPVLAQVISAGGAVDRQWFTTAGLNREFSQQLADSAQPTAMSETVAAAALSVALARDWLDTPTWMERLLRRLNQVQGLGGIPAVPILAAVADRIARGENILDAAWSACWVRNQYPMIDRRELRGTLQAFARQTRDSRPILRIEGDEFSGKSYSHELMQFVSQENGWSFQVARIELEKEQVPFMNSVKLAGLIVDKLQGNPALGQSGISGLDPERPQKKDLIELGNWVVRTARLQGGNFWLMLDKFKLATQESLTRDLIEVIADQVANDNARRWLRLVLIDYANPLSRVDENQRVAYDRPMAGALDAAAVRDCLKAACEANGKHRDDAELLERAQAIVNALPANAMRLPTLRNLVRDAAEDLVHGT